MGPGGTWGPGRQDRWAAGSEEDRVKPKDMAGPLKSMNGWRGSFFNGTLHFTPLKGPTMAHHTSFKILRFPSLQSEIQVEEKSATLFEALVGVVVRIPWV